MNAATYLLILLLFSGQASALEVVVPLQDPQSDLDADEADSGDYPLADQKQDWPRASLRRRPAAALSQFAGGESLSSLARTATSPAARWIGPFRPPALYVLMSLQR